MITNGQVEEFTLDLEMAELTMPPALRRAIKAIASLAQTVHQSHHRGLLMTNIRSNPDGSPTRVYDPLNLDAITWRSCPKPVCTNARTEIGEILREGREGGAVR